MDPRYAEINRYLTSPDYAIILYSVIWQTVNHFAVAGNRVVVFSFSSSEELLSWLSTGKSVPRDKVQLQVAYTTLDLFQQWVLSQDNQNHIKVVQNSVANKNSVVLVVTSKEEDDRTIHSVTSVEMVTDPVLFEEFRSRRQELLQGLEN